MIGQQEPVKLFPSRLLSFLMVFRTIKTEEKAASSLSQNSKILTFCTLGKASSVSA